jgi:hypothetical protein
VTHDGSDLGSGHLDAGHLDAGHLDAEALADLQEGLLDATAAGTATAHVASCAQCKADQLALERVRGFLAAAPDPGPMPDLVAARIEHALREGTLDPADTEAPPAPLTTASAATVTPVHPTRPRSPWSSRILQAAAVLVLLLAGAGIAVSAFLNRQDAGSDSSAAGGGAVASDSTDRSAAESQAQSLGTSYHATGHDYTAQSVAIAAPGLIGTGTRYKADAGSEADNRTAPRAALAGAPAGLQRLGPGKALTACATSLAAGGPSTPLAVDLARFEGQPAAVIVLPTEGDPASMDVWVVGPGCKGQDEKVLHFARVASP